MAQQRTAPDKYRPWLGLALFLLLCYFPLFLHLDTLSLRLWDESRRGVSAIEMAQGGSWLTPTFEGSPDMYGTKPPLLIWLQALFMKILGYNELAVRLPSALAGLATVLLLLWFSRRHLQQPLAGYFAGLILLTSKGYINYHGAISGDYDALLTLWLTAYSICFYLFLERQSWRYLYLAALFILLAGWTKGVAGLFFIPALGLYALWRGRLLWLLKQPRLYACMAATAIGILAYYWLREQANPGYIAAVLENEVGGRYLRAQEGMARPFWFYFRVVNQYERFYPWQYFLPLGFALGWWKKSLRPATGFIMTISLFFLLLISVGKTKHEWYYLPALPLLALLIGLGMEQALRPLLEKMEGWKRPVLLALLALALFGAPYAEIIDKVYAFEHEGWNSEQTVYRDFMRRVEGHKAYTILHPSYNGHIAFYKKVYNLKGYDIRQHLLHAPEARVQLAPSGPPEFPAGTVVMACEEEARQALEGKFEIELLEEWRGCWLVRVGERR
ncbi:MAG: glycosyltransferase family 39 protein [Phaeodactylibacter sp.]|nr:glycosyltransferase family 39 protein [Phaeodactylibacter sp.]MCB9272588.1 glycosyltransferase family 39 protein [Lewinellaceae bacterium]